MTLPEAIASLKATGHAEYPRSDEIDDAFWLVRCCMRQLNPNGAWGSATDLATLALDIWPELREPESRKD